MSKDKLMPLAIGFIIGCTFMSIGFLMFNPENETNISEVDVQPEVVESHSVGDTTILGSFYTIDAVKVDCKVVTPDTTKVKMELRNEFKEHTAEWLYHFGKDSLNLGFPIIQMEFDNTFHEIIEEQIRAEKHFINAQAQLELNKKLAEQSKDMVDHLVDSLNNLKKSPE
jgi:hypothetical protein